MIDTRLARKPWLAAPLLLLLAAGCGTGDTSRSDEASGAGGRTATARGASRPTATVIQTMDAGGYTYAELDVDGEPTWFAGPVTPIGEGDTVVTPPRSLPMRGFRSDSLDRTFDVVYFVDAIRKVTAADPALAAREAHGAAPPTDVDLTDIPKAEGGMTVAEIHALGADGAGQEIVLRGRVVKFSANILGKNWLHVRDGSGAEGTNDLVVTTGDVVDVGDTVLVRGTLVADRDLGHGYKYDLLIEDAAVTVE